MKILEILGTKKPKPAAVKPARKAIPTIEDLRGKTYAVYTSTGVQVDLEGYFATPAGKDAMAKVAKSSGRSVK